MAKYQLSNGALKDIMNGSDFDDAILQILGVRKIATDKNRYRLLISDGLNMVPWAMVSTQVAERFTITAVPTNSIIRLKKYFTTCIKQKDEFNQRVVVILDMDILQNGEEVESKIGSPVLLDLSEEKKEKTSSTDTKVAPKVSNQLEVNQSNDENQNAQRDRSTSALNTSAGELQLSDQVINSISTLNPYLNKWVIRARVMSKSNLKSWSNSRGEGKLFSVDVADQSSKIRITAFRDEAEKYYEVFQVDKVYFISRAIVKIANKQFNSLNNQYELTLSKFSIVQQCFDENIPIPEVTYNFTPFDKISQVESNGVIDVIGVCKSFSNVQNLRSRNNDRDLSKREIVLQDDTNTCVSLTLWGTEAVEFECANNPVILLGSARVSDYNGAKQLSTITNTVLKIDPDIPEAHRIKGWYENYGVNEEGVNISMRTGSSAGGFGIFPWKTFADVTENEIKDADKGLQFQTKATILTVRSTRAFYKACPSESCNKKVNDLQNGMYRCEKCNCEYPKFKYRLLTSAHVGDYTGSQWLQLYNDECEKVLGVTSEEFGEIAETNELEAASICDNANFQEFIFKCRTKLEFYNDESRLKTSASKCEPINYKDYNSYLIAQINELTSNK